MCCRRGAGPPGQHGQQLGDPPRRGAAHERGDGGRAQRAQPLGNRARASAADLDPTRGEKGIEPGYEQKEFPDEEKRGRLRLVASPDGAEGSVTIHQDARLYASILEPGEQVEHSPGRGPPRLDPGGPGSGDGERGAAGSGGRGVGGEAGDPGPGRRGPPRRSFSSTCPRREGRPPGRESNPNLVSASPPEYTVSTMTVHQYPDHARRHARPPARPAWATWSPTPSSAQGGDRGRGQPPQTREERGDPRAQLHGAGPLPLGARLHRRLALLEPRSRQGRGRHHRLLRGPVHGGDGQDPEPGSHGAACPAPRGDARWPRASPPRTCAR